jgi:hypothetical protein
MCVYTHKEVFVMPGGDKTGPRGDGSLTGRGLGSCVSSEESQKRGFFGFLGRGLGRGQGRVRGSGWKFWQRRGE